MVWKLPRSDDLVTSAALMPTHTVATTAGGRFPAAMGRSMLDYQVLYAQVAPVPRRYTVSMLLSIRFGSGA